MLKDTLEMLGEYPITEQIQFWLSAAAFILMLIIKAIIDLLADFAPAILVCLYIKHIVDKHHKDPKP